MLQILIRPERIVAGTQAKVRVIARNPSDLRCWSLSVTLAPSNGLARQGWRTFDCDVVPPGDTEVGNIELQGVSVGPALIAVPSLSYVDGRGRSQLVDDAPDIRLSVERSVRQPPPTVELELVTTTLPVEQWEDVTVRVAHRHGARVRSLTVSAVGGQVRWDEATSQHRFREVTPGSDITASFTGYAPSSGSRVPASFALDIVDVEGRHRRQREDRHVNVRPAADRSDSDRSSSRQGGERDFRERAPTRILSVSAEPRGADVLETDVIDERLVSELSSRLRSTRCTLRQCGHATVARLITALLQHRPHIVIMSGHGTPDGRFCLEDDGGGAHPLTPSDLARIFGFDRGRGVDRLECVLLMSCHSQAQVNATVQHVPFVVGAPDEITNATASAFLQSFVATYVNGYDNDIVSCFELGAAAAAAAPDGSAESFTLRRKSVIG